MVVLRGPQQQTPHRGWENRFAVQHVDHRFELIARQFAAFVDRHHNPHALLFTKRHAHAAARFGAEVVRQQVVERAGQWNRQGNVSNGHVFFLTWNLARQYTHCGKGTRISLHLLVKFCMIRRLWCIFVSSTYTINIAWCLALGLEERRGLNRGFPHEKRYSPEIRRNYCNLFLR